jgi:hypothetical protein
MQKILLLLAMTLFLLGCTIPNRKLLQNCTYEPTSWEMVQMHHTTSQWRMYLNFRNPNSKKVHLSPFHLHLTLDGDSLSVIRNLTALTVPPQDSLLIPLELSLEHSKVLQTLMRNFNRPSLKPQVSGTMQVRALGGILKWNMPVYMQTEIKMNSLLPMLF